MVRVAGDYTLSPLDESGAVLHELEGNGFQAAGGFTLTDRESRAHRPASRVTPLGGEPLPSPVTKTVPVAVQMAENRILFLVSCLLIVAGLILFVPSMALLMGGQ